MEVVEAAAQLQTLQFGGSGQGPAAAAEERPGAEQAERAPPAGEQPPPPTPAPPSAEAGGSPPQPDRPPPSEACVTGPDAAEPPPALQASDDSDSDSDRWGAAGVSPGAAGTGGAGNEGQAAWVVAGARARFAGWRPGAGRCARALRERAPPLPTRALQRRLPVVSAQS